MAGTALASDAADRLKACPGVQRVPTAKLDLFIKRGFLSADECRALIALIDQRRRPSTIADDRGESLFRTSETCDFDPAEPAVQDLHRRIAQMTGLDPCQGEPMQGQRYDVGQEFKPHTDYFEPHGSDFLRYCAETGQRTWTVMIYLNAPEAGGATRFKAIDKTVQAEPGKLLAWSNLLPDGSVNPATLHHGMKVRSGTKYIVTKWYRERPWV